MTLDIMNYILVGKNNMKYVIPVLIFFGIGGLLFVSNKGLPAFVKKSVPIPPVVMMMEQDKSVPIPPTAAYAPEVKRRPAPVPRIPNVEEAVPLPVPPSSPAVPNFEASATFWFRMCISLIGFVSAIYVILSKKFDESLNKWGYSTIGMILGFWLK